MTEPLKIPYITDGATYVTLVFDNKPHTLKKTFPKFNEIVNALTAGDHTRALQLANITTTLYEYTNGKVSIKDGVLTYNGQVIHTTLTARIFDMIAEGLDFTPMVKFFENLMKNPSRTSVMELYDFLSASKLPITPDGHFLAYKKVRPDYKDIYTNSIDNSPSQVVFTERNAVDDDRHNHCSQGLHFAAYSYLDQYGSCRESKIILLKINPKDVVSIPTDYGFAKGRCCRYEVLADVTSAGDFLKNTSSVHEYKSVVKSVPAKK